MIQKSCQYVDLVDYEILDPKHHEINRPFQFVLTIADSKDFSQLKGIGNTFKAWHLTPPHPDLPPEKKKEWIEFLRAIKIEHSKHRDKTNFKKTDIPKMEDLEGYLNSRLGQVVEITLPDRRRLGIYPDGELLKGLYDIEYHASTAVNIAKLFGLFDASEIIIKEI